MIYDCAIIGGGPAGLNAALVLGRARRNVTLIDNNRPRNSVTHASRPFITRDGVPPIKFRLVAYVEVLRYPSAFHTAKLVFSWNKDWVVCTMPSQLVYAAAEGSRTAMGVNMDMTEEDFK